MKWNEIYYFSVKLINATCSGKLLKNTTVSGKLLKEQTYKPPTINIILQSKSVGNQYTTQYYNQHTTLRQPIIRYTTRLMKLTLSWWGNLSPKKFHPSVSTTRAQLSVAATIRGNRGQNSGGSRLVAGLESAVAARISHCN